jgi:predicted SnoaL-like aldol condensation-catalyzing enzyme
MNANIKQTVTNFIEEIWNQNQFERIDNYIHPSFVDHSLPSALPANKDGLQIWITETGKSFVHKTTIEEIVSEDDKVMIKINMSLKHVGRWRDIEATELEVSTKGYRYFKFADKKIIQHWALIDGTAIENKLREAHQGCKVPQ